MSVIVDSTSISIRVHPRVELVGYIRVVWASIGRAVLTSRGAAGSTSCRTVGIVTDFDTRASVSVGVYSRVQLVGNVRVMWSDIG